MSTTTAPLPLYYVWHGRRYGRPGSRGAVHVARPAPGAPGAMATLCGRRWSESELDIGGGIEPMGAGHGRSWACRACCKRLEAARADA